ncbi:DUF4258 domain-containing protein [Candidatus Woesearchaeota archaeon]|nr:DUF4258 domain-containing protein [Candidatus Woesearchaeota archaeon]
MKDILIDNKPVWISSHAIKQAEERGIAFPDRVYGVLKTGKIVRFGKNLIKVVKKSSKGSIVCIGVDNGNNIVIKTIERGN